VTACGMSGRLALQLAFSCKNKLAMAQSIATMSSSGS
jgi:hypothetical protein